MKNEFIKQFTEYMKGVQYEGFDAENINGIYSISYIERTNEDTNEFENIEFEVNTSLLFEGDNIYWLYSINGIIREKEKACLMELVDTFESLNRNTLDLIELIQYDFKECLDITTTN